MSSSRQIDDIIKLLEDKSNLSQTDLPLVTSIKLFPPTPKPRLTFGVEFEMAIAGLTQKVRDPDPQDERKAAKIPYIATSRRDSPTFRVPEFWSKSVYISIDRVFGNNRIPAEVDHTNYGSNSPAWKPSDVRSWIIKDDGSIQPPESVDEFGIEKKDYIPSGYSWIPTEIITPVFFFGDVALRGVQQMLGVLSSNFRVNVNPSSGLHCHVGNRKDSFSLQTLQNFYATVWAFEPQFETIIPSSRLRNQYSYSLRQDTNLSNIVSAKDRHELPRLGLEMIFDKPVEISHLNRMVMNNGEGPDVIQRICYDMMGMATYTLTGEGSGGRLRKPTIEFRQHDATLDPTVVNNWTKLCVGLLEFADTVDPNILRAYLERHIDESPEEFPIEKILYGLGMPDIAEYYGKLAKDLLEREKDKRRQWEKELKEKRLTKVAEQEVPGSI